MSDCLFFFGGNYSMLNFKPCLSWPAFQTATNLSKLDCFVVFVCHGFPSQQHLKIISGWASTCDSVHWFWPSAADIVAWYPVSVTLSWYWANHALANQKRPSAIVRGDKYQLCKPLIWLDLVSNSRSSAPKAPAMPIEPPHPVQIERNLTFSGSGKTYSKFRMYV